MSRLSIQPHVGQPNCFPISKFSHHTGPVGSKNHTWTHVNYRQDLDLVLKEVRTLDNHGCQDIRSWLKVTGGAEILESQDLTRVVQYCKDYDPSSGQDHPVDVVVKCPFLAMRYPKGVDTLRRFQVKFRNETDFARAVELLRAVGLPIVDKSGSGPSTGIQTAPSPSPSLMSSASSFNGRLSLPRPASTNSLGYDHTTSGMAMISPVRSDFKVPLRPESAASDDRTMSHDLAFPGFQVTRPCSTSGSTSASGHGGQLSRMAPFQEPSTQLPSMYLSQLERESQLRRLSHPVQQTTTISIPNSSESLYASQIQPYIERAPTHPEDSSRLLNQSPFFSSETEKRLLAHDDVFYKPQNSSAFDLERPASTPTDIAGLQHLWLPPRRELPFPKPREPVRTQSSSTRDFPELPKPTPVLKALAFKRPASAEVPSASTPAAKPAPKKRIAQRKTIAPKTVEEPTGDFTDVEQPAPKSTAKTLGKNSTTQADDDSHLAAKSAATDTRPPSTTPGLVSKVAAPAKKRPAPARPSSAAKKPKVVDQCTQTLPVPDRTSVMSTAAAAFVPGLVADALSPVLPPKNSLTAIDGTKHKARSAPQKLEELPGWADVSDENREMMLNDFICEQLGNKDFLKLCEDMEFAWRRIGLGR